MTDSVLDDLKDFRFDSAKVRGRSRWWLVLGALLVILFFSLVLVEYPLGDIIEGNVESDRLVRNQVVADDVTLTFSADVVQWLQGLFVRFQDREFSVCLAGKYNDNAYAITAGYQPKVIDSSVFHVTFEACDTNTLVILHSHPTNRCVASAQDMTTLKESQIRNPAMVMVVMCTKDKFSVYK